MQGLEWFFPVHAIWKPSKICFFIISTYLPEKNCDVKRGRKMILIRNFTASAGAIYFTFEKSNNNHIWRKIIITAKPLELEI